MSAENGGISVSENSESDFSPQCGAALPVIEPPQCNLEKYGEYIKDFDLTEEDKIELLKTLWMMMASFVDLGIGVDSIQFLTTSSQKPQSASDQEVDSGAD